MIGTWRYVSSDWGAGGLIGVVLQLQHHGVVVINWTEDCEDYSKPFWKMFGGQTHSAGFVDIHCVTTTSWCSRWLARATELRWCAATLRATLPWAPAPPWTRWHLPHRWLLAYICAWKPQVKLSPSRSQNLQCLDHKSDVPSSDNWPQCHPWIKAKEN